VEPVSDVPIMPDVSPACPGEGRKKRQQRIKNKEIKRMN
jgi:hypothetical protein